MSLTSICDSSRHFFSPFKIKRNSYLPSLISLFQLVPPLKCRLDR